MSLVVLGGFFTLVHVLHQLSKLQTQYFFEKSPFMLLKKRTAVKFPSKFIAAQNTIKKTKDTVY